MSNTEIIYQYVRLHPRRTVAEIAEGVRLPPLYVRNRLRDLVRDGRLRARRASQV